MTTKTTALLALIAAMALPGCVEKSRDLTRTEREQLARFVGETATTPDHEVNIDFEGKVELVGYDTSSTFWAPGEEITLTWHWRVNRALEDGWRLFTHVSDGSAPTIVNEDGAGLVRDLYQPGRWKAGEYIRDQQVITLPADWNGESAIVYVGLWNGPNRLRVIDGPSDGDNRGRVATLRVGRARSRVGEPGRPDVPTLRAGEAPVGEDGTSALNIDGLLNEPAWAAAASSRAFVNTMTGGPAPFSVTARTLYDSTHFYVGFIVADSFLKSDFTEHDEHLWEADTVEIMVDPDGDGRNYFEMQVSPRNVSFDTRYDRRRHPGPIGHADWDSELRSAVNLRGTLDDEDGDDGYSVEIAIPWAAFAHGQPPASPPRAGQSWRVNFYVMNQTEDGMQYAAWSPPRVGDFHMPNRFGTVEFGAPHQPAQQLQLDSPVRLRPQAPEIESEGEVAHRNRPQQGETLPQPPSDSRMGSSMSTMTTMQ